MGEIAEMMLDGTLCQGCGEYLGSSDGFPGYCPSCAPRRAKQARKRRQRRNAKRTTPREA